jgi:hypothetical protein
MICRSLFAVSLLGHQGVYPLQQSDHCLRYAGLLFTRQFRRFGGAQLFHQHPFRCAFQIYTRIMDRRLLLRAKRFDKIGHTEAAGGARF